MKVDLVSLPLQGVNFVIWAYWLQLLVSKLKYETLQKHIDWLICKKNSKLQKHMQKQLPDNLYNEDQSC